MPTVTGDEWVAKASMPTARYGLAVSASGNGKLYAIGGYNGVSVVSTCEEYDPATNSWATKAAMPTARLLLAAAAGNGKLYAIGGATSQGANVFAIATCEEYDPSTNTWTARAPMNTARDGFAAVTPGDGKLYAMGGRSSGNVYGSCEQYDPSANIWTNKASMRNARINFAAAAPGNGKIYVFGGYFSTADATCEEYDPRADIWTVKTSMNAPRGYLAAAAPGNGKLYAIGGFSNGYLSTCEEYDPGIGFWVTVGSMPVPIGFSGAAAPGNQKLYVIGGEGSTGIAATCLEYTPSGNSGVARVERPVQFSLSVSPNPAQNSITLHANLLRTEEVQIDMFDITGHRLPIRPLNVLSEGSHDIVTPTASLANGTYFFRLSSSSGDHAETRIVVKR